MKNFVVNKKVIWVMVFTMLLQCLPLTTLAAAENNKKNKVSISDYFSKAKTSCFKTFKVLTDADYARAYRRQAYANIDYKEKLELERFSKKIIGQKTGKERTKGIRNFNAIRLVSRIDRVSHKLGVYAVTSPAIIGSEYHKICEYNKAPRENNSVIKLGNKTKTSIEDNSVAKLINKTKSSINLRILRIKNHQKS